MDDKPIELMKFEPNNTVYILGKKIKGVRDIDELGTKLLNLHHQEKELKKLNFQFNELNELYCKIIEKCESAIKNRHYLDDSVVMFAKEIKDMCHYYVCDAKRIERR